MVKKYKGLELKYVSVDPIGTITELPNMTDAKFGELVDKNGIYKAIYISAERLGVEIENTPVVKLRLVLEEEKKLWDSAKRNSLLFCTQRLYRFQLMFNVMTYIGLKDPNLKVDSNCPYPEGITLTWLSSTPTSKRSQIKLIATDGSEIYLYITGINKIAISLNPNENLTNLTSQTADITTDKVLKKANNTMFIDDPMNVGGYRIKGTQANYNVLQFLFLFDYFAKISTEFAEESFTKVNSIDDVLNDGEFFSIALNETIQTFGSVFPVQKRLTTGGFSDTFASSRDYINSIYGISESSLTTKTGETPKLRLLLLKEGKASYVDTAFDFKFDFGEDNSIYPLDVLTLNGGKILILTTTGLYRAFNGVLKKNKFVSGSTLKISNKKDVGFEKHIIPDSSFRPFLTMSTSDLDNETNYKVAENNSDTYFRDDSAKMYVWK